MANRRFVQRPRKRAMSWQGFSIDFADLVNGTAQAAAAIPENILENFPTPTLIRTRGGISVWTDPSSTPGGFGVLTVGLIFVTAAALAANGVPSPLADSGNDFFYWDTFHVGASATDVIGEDITVDRKVVDSKSMRKIGLNEVVALSAEWLTCEGTMVVNMCGVLRILMKAP